MQWLDARNGWNDACHEQMISHQASPPPPPIKKNYNRKINNISPGITTAINSSNSAWSEGHIGHIVQGPALKNLVWFLGAGNPISKFIQMLLSLLLLGCTYFHVGTVDFKSRKKTTFMFCQKFYLKKNSPCPPVLCLKKRESFRNRQTMVWWLGHYLLSSINFI